MVLFVVGVNEPLNWYHTISTGCDGSVYGWCEWTVRLVPYNQYWVWQWGLQSVWMNLQTGTIQSVLGVTVRFTVSVNEPSDWYHTISTGCDSEVYGWCEWTIRLVPYNQYLMWQWGLQSVWMNLQTGTIQSVLGVTVRFTVSVNEPSDWYHTISTGCDSEVYGWCEWTIRLVPYNQYWVWQWGLWLVWMNY